MFCATPKFWSSGEGFPTAKPGAAVTGQSGNPEKDRSRHLATQGASFADDGFGELLSLRR
jgi:hypothetical protein